LNLRGKVALITGASDGIGRACAEVLRKRGARLSLSGLPNREFQTGRDCAEVRTAGDITDPAVRQEIVSETLASFGQIDILINNAGVGLYAPPSTAPVDLSKRMFDVNVFAAAAVTQAVLPHMRKQESGVIVTIGSVGGYVALPWAVMYCASKFALHAYSDSLRRELRGSGISVLKVCLGIVETDFRKHVLAGIAPDGVQHINHRVSPSRVAEAVARGIENNARQVYLPRIGWLFAAFDLLAPTWMDMYLARKW
jgi:short-subunit dehydrogenase